MRTHEGLADIDGRLRSLDPAQRDEIKGQLGIGMHWDVEVTEEGEAAWVRRCIEKARDTGDFFENCTPGYYNNEGKTGEQNAQNGFYGGGSIEFFRLLSEWRADGGLQGLELK